MSDDGSSDRSNGINSGVDWQPPRTGVESTDLDRIFGILADRRRRYLLYFLVQVEEGLAERSELVDVVRAFESADPASDEPGDEDAVERNLHHQQLPHLARAGVIDYDRRQGTVRYEREPSVEEWLEHAHYKEVGHAL